MSTGEHWSTLTLECVAESLSGGHCTQAAMPSVRSIRSIVVTDHWRGFACLLSINLNIISINIIIIRKSVRFYRVVDRSLKVVSMAVFLSFVMCVQTLVDSWTGLVVSGRERESQPKPKASHKPLSEALAAPLPPFVFGLRYSSLAIAITSIRSSFRYWRHRRMNCCQRLSNRLMYAMIDWLTRLNGWAIGVNFPEWPSIVANQLGMGEQHGHIMEEC